MGATGEMNRLINERCQVKIHIVMYFYNPPGAKVSPYL